jgi:hypothetical protein
MRFHARRLFRPRYEPRQLCFAVRRSADHSPEGLIRIDAAPVGDAPPEPIFTVSAELPASPARRMHFALSAETRVEFGGSVHLHAWLSTRFAGGAALRGSAPPPRSLALVAAARQFSSFILLVGKIASPTVFEPTAAIIVKDKDELSIPLSLTEIPSPGEFRDAIASLSPEQQRFAKAFRAMQVCVGVGRARVAPAPTPAPAPAPAPPLLSLSLRSLASSSCTSSRSSSCSSTSPRTR